MLPQVKNQSHPHNFHFLKLYSNYTHSILNCAWALYLFYPGVISFTHPHCINFRNYSVLFLLIINGLMITFYRIIFRSAEPCVTSFEENTYEKKKTADYERIYHVKKYFIRICLMIIGNPRFY